MPGHVYDRHRRPITTNMPAHLVTYHTPVLKWVDLMRDQVRYGGVLYHPRLNRAPPYDAEPVWFARTWQLDTTKPHAIACKAQKAYKDTKLRRQRAAFASTSFGSRLPDDIMKRIYDETEEPSAEGLHAMGLQRRASRKKKKAHVKRSRH